MNICVCVCVEYIYMNNNIYNKKENNLLGYSPLTNYIV